METCRCLGAKETKRKGYATKTAGLPGSWTWLRITDKMGLFQNDDDDLQSNTYGSFWGPKTSACLQNITYLEEHGAMFRLKPATLSMHGLRVCGVLWDVNCTVKVPKTHGQFASKWQEEVSL